LVSQLLIDKVVGKLPKWKGRLLNKSGRLTLVNSVLSTVVLYHMAVFPLSKWAIKRIDRIHINFLWLRAEAARGGHCHINWQIVQRPKELGGLGILDLAKFSRALRLRWQWYKQKDKEKSWAQMNIPHNAIEVALFTTCTKVTVANGKDINF
jgi:hypothetical protein